MERFEVRPMVWPTMRVFSRNPLVRASDRIESGVNMLTFLLVIVTAACAGVLGTFVHDAGIRAAVQEARTRHLVVATAMADSTAADAWSDTPFIVRARWRLDGVNRIGDVSWKTAVKANEALQIWINDQGERVSPPSPTSSAASDAVAVAMVAWLIGLVTIVGGVACVRLRLAGMRNAQWDNDIRCLVGNEGGHFNTPH